MLRNWRDVRHKIVPVYSNLEYENTRKDAFLLKNIYT